MITLCVLMHAGLAAHAHALAVQAHIAAVRHFLAVSCNRHSLCLWLKTHVSEDIRGRIHGEVKKQLISAIVKEMPEGPQRTALEGFLDTEGDITPWDLLQIMADVGEQLDEQEVAALWASIDSHDETARLKSWDSIVNLCDFRTKQWFGDNQYCWCCGKGIAMGATVKHHEYGYIVCGKCSPESEDWETARKAKRAKVNHPHRCSAYPSNRQWPSDVVLVRLYRIATNSEGCVRNILLN